jgi:hypothetical protein
MSGLTTSCPSCGAKIEFRWSSAVQTTCPFCKSILVRHDVDLTKVGEVGDLPVDQSPIQLGTTGTYDRRNFAVVGRILYEYERGGWNEWHLRMDDSTSAWLSDAMAEYAVSSAVESPDVPAADRVKVGERYQWNGRSYVAATLTKAHYRGVEGELPFETWNRDDALFMDLDADDGHFATIDYSDDTPALYLGEYAEFDDLHLGNLRTIEGW